MVVESVSVASSNPTSASAPPMSVLTHPGTMLFEELKGLHRQLSRPGVATRERVFDQGIECKALPVHDLALVQRRPVIPYLPIPATVPGIPEIRADKVKTMARKREVVGWRRASVENHHNSRHWVLRYFSCVPREFPSGSNRVKYPPCS